MRVDLNRIDRARETGQHRGLIAGTGADLEHFFGAGKLGDLAHERDHVWLRDSLRVANRQRAVVVSVVVKFSREESMAGDRAHRGEHARIFYPAALELFEHPPPARTI